jgi:tetrahydromethanopterin S-methyltransferase subunit B
MNSTQTADILAVDVVELFRRVAVLQQVVTALLNEVDMPPTQRTTLQQQLEQVWR